MRTALVVGAASHVWDDVSDATALGSYDAVCCVKQVGIQWPGKFDVWATLHPELMDGYEEERRKLGRPGGYEIVAPPTGEVGMHGKKGNISRRVSYRWPGMTGSASSGIYGAKVMLDAGFERVVLAGIPMTGADGHIMPDTRNAQGQVRGKEWTHVQSFIPGLLKAVPHMKGKVKSVSGYTAELLGFPTADWLGSGPAPLGNADARSEDQHREGPCADASRSAGAEQ